jgi:hypothetical protein
MPMPNDLEYFFEVYFSIFSKSILSIIFTGEHQQGKSPMYPNFPRRLGLDGVPPSILWKGA